MKIESLMSNSDTVDLGGCKREVLPDKLSDNRNFCKRFHQATALHKGHFYKNPWAVTVIHLI